MGGTGGGPSVDDIGIDNATRTIDLPMAEKNIHCQSSVILVQREVRMMMT
jgi:hypothetical protein